MLKENDILHGFKVTRVRHIDELQSTLTEMTHIKTGAQLCFHNNGDENKVFSVTFKTIPENDTGVFHILEHSVLCGSEKYQVKEPFVELLKSSLNTFLNAMTFSDKTMYPVSSRNAQDYLNLMSVYLDAVFAPDILKNPYIFYQEGWHIDLNDEPTYKGVVLNEMKGAMSDVEEVMRQGVNRLLFGDTCYGFNSGGEPSHIIDLTYDEFIKTYQRFYHPSNARFFIDGDVPLDETLSMIDGYLDQFDKSETVINVPAPAPLKTRRLEQYYEVDDDNELDHQAQLSIGKLLGTWEDKTTNMMQGILVDVLAGSNEAPLVKALLDAQLVEDVNVEVDDSIANVVTCLNCRNIDPKDEQAIKDCVKDTITSIYQNGLDKDMLHAAINQLSFRLRTPGEPQGLMRAILSLSSWLHGGDPLLNLVYNDTIQTLRDKVDSGEYEELMMKMFIEDDDTVTVLTLPSPTLGEQVRARENARLKDLMDQMSDDEYQSLVTMNKNLLQWQSTPDSLEQLATLPVLTLDAVDEKPVKRPVTEMMLSDVKVLQRYTTIAGVVHLRLYFDLSDFTLEELTKINLMTEFLEEMPTEKRDALTLQKDVKSLFGRLNMTVRGFNKNRTSKEGTPYLLVTASLLEENLTKAAEVIQDIALHTIFDHERMEDIIRQSKEEARQLKIMSGHSVASIDTLAHYDVRNRIQKALIGSGMIDYLENFDINDDNLDDLMAFYHRIIPMIFVKSRLFVSVSATHELHDELLPIIDSFADGEAIEKREVYEDRSDFDKTMVIPAGINYAVKGYHLGELNRAYDGSAAVAANILSLSYLWNVVRVQGGAYGTGITFGLTGSMMAYSYRDPSPAKTLEAYKGMSDFLREFVEGDEPIDKYIISTIASTEPLMADVVRGMRGDETYLTGFTYDDAVKNRQEMLRTTKTDLLKWCDVLDHLATEGATCVVGHSDALADIIFDKKHDNLK